MGEVIDVDMDTLSATDNDDEEERPCPECECYPSQPASGSDGDPATPYYRSWTCTCACHEPLDDGPYND